LNGNVRFVFWTLTVLMSGL